MRIKIQRTKKGRKKIFALFILWPLISFTDISHATEITLNTVGVPPLNTPEQTGFMDLVATEAFRRIGVTLKTIQLPAERGLLRANAGIEDGEMGRVKGINKLYPNLVRVPEKIMDWEFFAISQIKINLDKGWLSLTPYSVAFLNGWKILENKVPGQTSVTKVRTLKQLFTMLIKKRTDLILYERWGALSYIRRKKLNAIKLQKPRLAKKEIFIYLHKKRKVLVPKLAKALRQMKQDGYYNKIVKKILLPLE